MTRIEAVARRRGWPGLAERLGGMAAMKRLMVAILAVAFVGTAVYWYARSAPEVKSPASFEVKKDHFTVKITELGELRSLDSVTISSRTYDAVITYLVPEGTRVKKEEVMARLDPSRYEVALDHDKAKVQVAQAERRKAEKDLEVQRQQLLAEIVRLKTEVRLAQLELDELKRKPLPDEVERARMELEKAEVAFGNAEKKRNLLPELVEKGFITKDTLDKAELDYLQAKANLQVARFDVSKVSAGAMPDELQKAQIRLEQARSALETAQRSIEPKLQSFEAAVERAQANVEQAKNAISKTMVWLDRTVLRAPRDGLVVYAKAGRRGSSEKIQLGMIPYRGQPLFHLSDLSTMVVDTQINEIDIGKVNIGGSVEVRLGAYPGAVFHGTILQIASLANSKRSLSQADSGIKVFDVTVQIEEKDPRLKPGLTASLDIIVEHQENVISIPLSAVASRRGEHVVFVSHAEKIEERQVVLGPSNDHSVVVKTGLRSGEQVLLDLPASGSL
jgi:HlyD family secretion protein